MQAFNLRFLLIILIAVYSTACAPRSVKLYDGPALDASKVATVRGKSGTMRLLKVDDNKTPVSFWSGFPKEVYLLPGFHSVEFGFKTSLMDDVNKSSLWRIEFKAEKGEVYSISTRYFANKLYFWLTDARGERIYKKDDLEKNITNRVDTEGENLSFYRLRLDLHVDFFVSMVRQGYFNSPWSKTPAAILLSFGLLNDKEFDCNAFYNKLTVDQKNQIDSLMKNYPFVCKDRNYSDKEALTAFDSVLGGNVDTSEIADAHWAWFSATGSPAILEKILNNYLYVNNSCRECIQWSFKSIASHNGDAKDFLAAYSEKKSPEEQSKLKLLLPHQ